MDHEHMAQRKLVAVGSDDVGKTCLLLLYKYGIFREAHIPRLMDGYVGSIELKQRPVQLILWDTTGNAAYERRLRPLAYPYTHAFLVCFSVDDPESFEDVQSKWIVELRHYIGRSAPIYLVGCKIDLRTDPQTLNYLTATGQSAITTAQGEDMAKRIGAAAYFECSSKTGEGVRLLFLRILEATDDRVISRSSVKWSRGKGTKETGCIVM